MIWKPTQAPEDELQIIFKLHHQSSIDHDAIVLWYTKGSLMSMFIVIKD
jgi:hypothetical protein